MSQKYVIKIWIYYYIILLLLLYQVRHPGVIEQIQIDFIIMKNVAYFLESILGLKWLRLSDSLSQFSHTIAAQTNLNIERDHLQIFNKNFKNWKNVKFPVPIASSTAVLIETFEEGISIAEYTEMFHSKNIESLSSSQPNMASYKVAALSFLSYLYRGQKSADMVASNPENDDIHNKGNNISIQVDPELAHFVLSSGVDIYLKMLLVDNLMHADLHPGNILLHHTDIDGNKIPPPTSYQNDDQVVTNTNNQNNNHDATIIKKQIPFQKSISKLVFVDAGMVATLIEKERENFIGLLESIGEGNGAEAAKHVLSFSSNSYTRSTTIQFEKDMTELFNQTCRGYGTNVIVGDVLRGILNLVRVHQLSIDINYATLVMNVLCLDGLARSLLPEYNIVDAAKILLKYHRICKKSRLGLTIFRSSVSIMRLLKKRLDRLFINNYIAERNVV